MWSRLIRYIISLLLVTMAVTRGWGRRWGGGKGWGRGWRSGIGRTGYHGGRLWGGGFRGHRGFSRFGGFRPGYGAGSLSSGRSFRNSMLGSAMGAFGGMLAYDAAKRMFRPSHIPYRYGGRDYYWDEYRNPQDGYIICSISVDELKNLAPVNAHARRVRETAGSALDSSLQGNKSDIIATPSPENALENLQYSNGTKPQLIVWACKKNVEICCGTECCPLESDVSVTKKEIVVTILVVIIFLLLGCCLIFLLRNMCGASSEMEGPMGTPNDMGFEPYSPYYGPDYGSAPPMYPAGPGVMPVYMQPGYPPPYPPYPDCSQPPQYRIYTNGNYAFRERFSGRASTQKQSMESSKDEEEKSKRKSDAEIPPKQRYKIPMATKQNKKLKKKAVK